MQLLIPERSAMAVTQKMNIFSNELIRRLWVERLLALPDKGDDWKVQRP